MQEIGLCLAEFSYISFFMTAEAVLLFGKQNFMEFHANAVHKALFSPCTSVSLLINGNFYCLFSMYASMVSMNPGFGIGATGPHSCWKLLV